MPVLQTAPVLQMAVVLLFIHFIGDFVFQSTDMAVNKARSLKWLFVHVGVYTTCLTIGCLLLFEPGLAVTYGLVNGVIHLVTDFVTSKVISRLYLLEDKKWYYTGIGFDQFIHGASLLLTYEYIVLN